LVAHGHTRGLNVEGVNMSLELNPFSPEFQADPYPIYARFRSEAPVHRVEIMGLSLWVLTRYADVVTLLRDPRFSAAAVPRELMPPELFEGNIFYKDAPDHTRLRGLLNGAFNRQTIEGMRPRVQQIADELIDQHLRRHACRGAMEVIDDFAMPLSLTVVTEVLGVPACDRAQMKKWSDDLALLLDGTRILMGLADAQRSAGELIAYLRLAIEERRRHPRNDLLSALCAAQEAGDRLSEAELIATSVFTLIAGHETVTNLIGNGLRALFQHPAELSRLSAHLSLLPRAVEELLRWDSPGQLTIKLAKTKLELGGVCIPAGAAVCGVLGAANRDPAQFPDPERLDLGRAENRHLGFGQGAHFCIGAPLARIEAQVAFGSLLRRLPGLRAVPGGEVRQPGVVLRGLKSLQVAFDS
jgi:cytochrome P450